MPLTTDSGEGTTAHCESTDLVTRRCQLSSLANTPAARPSAHTSSSLKLVQVFSGVSGTDDFIDEAAKLEGFTSSNFERISFFGETAAEVLDPSTWDSVRGRLTAGGKQALIITLHASRFFYHKSVSEVLAQSRMVTRKPRVRTHIAFGATVSV